MVGVGEHCPVKSTKMAGCLHNFRGCWELSLGMKWPGCEARHVPADMKKPPSPHLCDLSSNTILFVEQDGNDI